MEMREDIQQALQILEKGGIILYPTDTLWAIGCDATHEQAVNRIYELKQRSDQKAMLVLVDSETRVQQYIKEVPEIAWELLDVADKPLTIIYPGARNLASNLIADDGSIGIRLVKDEFCQKLISRLKKPLVSTSANISGEPSSAIFDDIPEEIKNKVDYIVQWRQNDTSRFEASSIIKLDTNGRIKIIRP